MRLLGGRRDAEAEASASLPEEEIRLPEETPYEAICRVVDEDSEGHNDRVLYHAERVKDAVKTFLDTKAEWERLRKENRA